MLAPLGPEMFPEFEVIKGGQVGVGLEDDVPSSASIPSIGSASGDIFFPPERETAVSSITRLHKDACFVDEFQCG
jgi:hypothetical protein